VLKVTTIAPQNPKTPTYNIKIILIWLNKLSFIRMAILNTREWIRVKRINLQVTTTSRYLVISRTYWLLRFEKGLVEEDNKGLDFVEFRIKVTKVSRTTGLSKLKY